MMAGSSRDLNFIIGALDRSEKAFRKIQTQVDRLERRLDKLDGKNVDVGVDADTRKAERGLLRFRRALNDTDKPIRLTYGGLATLVAAAAAVAPAAVAAGAAFAGFGAVAAPSIIKTVTAFQEAGAGLDSLNERQRETAEHVQGLIDNYKELSESFEPQALQAFNNALTTGNTLMRQFTPVMDAGADAAVKFTARMNTEFSSPQWTEFFSFLANEAPNAVDQVGDAFFSAAGATIELVEALAPLSGVLIPVISLAADAVGAFADLSPEMTQMVLLAIAMRGAWGPLNIAMAALPGTLAATGTAATVATTALSGLVGIATLGAITLIAQDLQEAREAAEAFSATVMSRSDTVIGDIANVSAELDKQRAILDKMAELPSNLGTEEFRDQRAIVDRLSKDLGTLRTQRALDVQAAREQADIQGTVSRELTIAADTTQKLEDRLKAAKTALDALFTPSIDVFNATTTLKRGYDELITSLKDAKGNFAGNSEASLTLRDAFSQQLTTVTQLRDAVLRKTQSDGAARQAVANQIPILYAMAGADKSARAQVDALATSTGIVTGRTNTSKQAFFRTAKQMGLTKADARRLWKEYQKIPRNVRTNVSAPGLGVLIGNLRTARGLLFEINNTRIANAGPLLTGAAGGRAHGGPALSGRTYLVGERGPEIIRMGSNTGTVIPNRKLSDGSLGGGDTLVQVFIDGEEVRHVVRKEVRATNRDLKRNVLAGAGGAR